MLTIVVAMMLQAEQAEDTRPVVWDCIRVGMTEKEADAACGKDRMSDLRVHYTGNVEYQNKGKRVSRVTLRSFYTEGATMIASLEKRFGPATAVERVDRSMLEGRGLGDNVQEGQLFTWRLPYMTVEYLQPGNGKSGQVRYSVVDTERQDIVL